MFDEFSLAGSAPTDPAETDLGLSSGQWEEAPRKTEQPAAAVSPDIKGSGMDSR
jgi:hypothetical protein